MTSLRYLVTFALVVVAVGQAHGWVSQLDQAFQYSCHNNQILTHIRSEHRNREEDRLWDFGCSNLPQGTTLEQCSWSGYVNNFDELVGFICPSNKVMVGINSYHSNHFEDRRFKFLCCSPKGKVVHSCAMTGYANSFDGHLSYTVPPNRVLTGMVSVHSSGPEDRVFRFIHCKMGHVC